MDLVTTLKAPFNDAEWPRKVGMGAVLALIPIVGIFIQMGWLQRWYLARLQGSTVLPEAFEDIGGDLGRGFRLWLAGLLSFGPLYALLLFPPMLLVVGAGFVGESLATPFLLLGWLGFAIGYLLVMAVMVVAGPGAVHQQIVRERLWVWGGAGEILARVRGAPKEVALTFGGVLAANFAGGLGVLLCFVGVLFTGPLGSVMAMSVVAEWARVTDGYAPAE